MEAVPLLAEAVAIVEVAAEVPLALRLPEEDGVSVGLWEGVALGVTVGETVGVGLEMAAASSRRGPNRRKRTRSRARMGKGSPRRSSRESESLD